MLMLLSKRLGSWLKLMSLLLRARWDCFWVKRSGLLCAIFEARVERVARSNLKRIYGSRLAAAAGNRGVA